MSNEELKCPKCGAQISPEKSICGNCGTYYVVEGKEVCTFNDKPATDENLEDYIKKSMLVLKHHYESTGLQKYFGPEKEMEEKLRKDLYIAREHLTKELGRLPTIKEVEGRASQYILGKIQKENLELFEKEVKLFDLYVITIIVSTVLFLIVWFLYLKLLSSI